MKKISTVFSALFFTAALSIAQPTLNLPKESQASTISQQIGLSTIAVDYHSPLVNGRVIWGSLVPYEVVWRAGANENTTISFSDNVLIENQTLPAGTYGLHMIPSEKEWTIIFSKNHTSWGSFFYKPEEDALRIKVKATAHPFQEWLSYDFLDRKPNSAILALTWEKIQVAFKIDVDVNKVVLASIKDQLRTLPAFSWKGWNDAANYCLVNNVGADEALKWINRSIAMEENFTNLTTKSKLLSKKGDAKEAAELSKKAMTLATEGQLNTYGYQLMGENKTKEAIEIFEMNVKQHPNSWNVYDSLAEASEKAGDKAKALKNYSTALSKKPDDVNKDRITKMINKLSGK